MKIILLILMILPLITGIAFTKNLSTGVLLTDVRNIEYGITSIPADIKYSGSPVAMVKWDDDLGSNLLFITETNEFTNSDVRSKELFGYHYVTGEKGSKQLWKIYDFIKDCPVDLKLEYVNKSLTITDLDNNGTGESSFIYKMSCKGDVSADAMKLLMHEGENKYAIRGSMNLKMNGQDMEKGSMNIDASFKKAPEEFTGFAKSQWNKFNTEKTGE